NGIVFRGFLSGISEGVLSGGRYDPLLDRFGMSSAALGFAIYLDYIHHTELMRDTDALLIYSEADKPADVARAVKLLTKQGYLVLAAQAKPENRSFIKVFDIKEVLA
ncbi:MAG: ATP phosphoribosyltransferase regulatory subunit, partial [Clostridia bacterium]|nr:ATP phosphoribosyltransferase regulatory subunit [Clostridia bacterium]